MQTLQLFSPIKELNGVLLVQAKPNQNGNKPKVVRNGCKIHNEFGIYIAREGDEIYLRIPGDLKYNCVVLTVCESGSLSLTPDIRQYLVDNTTSTLENLSDIGKCESLHFIAKAYLVQPEFTKAFIEYHYYPSTNDLMSLRRALYTALRKANLAHTVYDDGTVGVKENTKDEIDWSTVVAWAKPVSE